MYMIFLLFHCQAAGDKIQLNEEFSEYCWVNEVDLQRLDLNVETADTLRRLGPGVQASEATRRITCRDSLTW